MTLQIYDPRERALVTAGDAALTALAALTWPFRRRRRPAAAARILLLRLERIGDLLMALPAIADVRAAAPDAEIDLVVGSWNVEVAQAIRGVSRVLVVDAPWLARDGSGVTMQALARTAFSWRSRRYDMAINFEPDVRSNAILALAGARWTAGYGSAGGGALLDQALEYRPADHTVDNALRLVHAVLGAPPSGSGDGRLAIPEAQRREASAVLAGSTRPLIAMHVAGGRAVKQWDLQGFAAVARDLADQRGATIVLTGGPADAPLVETVKRALPAERVVDVSDLASLLLVAAVLERCDLMVTGDTGPMHVATAVGTPIVAVFGPSDPRRYAPRGPRDRVVRVDLPCAPCNRIRLPPARCTGHMPDCLALVTPDRVFEAAVSILDAGGEQSVSAPA